MSIFYVLSKASDEAIASEISVLYLRGHPSLCDSLVVTQAEEFSCKMKEEYIENLCMKH